MRHVSQSSVRNVELCAQIIQIARQRRRWGYRIIRDVLRLRYSGINHKRVYRIYTADGLSIKKRIRALHNGVRVTIVAALAVSQTWNMDFVSETIARPGTICRRIKCLTVADDLTHECLDIKADFGIGGHYFNRLPDRAAKFRGYPKAVRTDNKPEFTCGASMTWTKKHVIQHILIERGSPTQNSYIESFNGAFRDEFLDES